MLRMGPLPLPGGARGICGAVGGRKALGVDKNLTSDEIMQYRREGYLVLRGLLGPGSVAACRQALSDLATGRIAARDTVLAFETGYAPEMLSVDEREFYIRKYMDFVEDAP